MRLLRTIFWIVVVAAMSAGTPSVRADETNAVPDFKEVYDLLKANLSGQGADELNRAAVEGLLNQLRTKVSLISSKTESNAPSEKGQLTKTATYDGPVGYLRIARVGEGLADQLSAAWKQVSDTNKLAGLIVDLRYADGRDYAAAAAAADLFVPKDAALLDWGSGMVKAKEKSSVISLPVVVLVNRQTAVAAEALAGVLRESAHAMILGAPTAGEATIGRDFPLSTGQFLRIATSAIKLGNGEALTGAGLKPDITVQVKPDDERAYYADPMKEMASLPTLMPMLTGTPVTTNRPARTRTSEADLIRERKERPGVEVEGLPTPDAARTSAEPDKPVVRDPALARALDLLRGIAAFRQTRAP